MIKIKRHFASSWLERTDLERIQGDYQVLSFFSYNDDDNNGVDVSHRNEFPWAISREGSATHLQRQPQRAAIFSNKSISFSSSHKRKYFPFTWRATSLMNGRDSNAADRSERDRIKFRADGPACYLNRPGSFLFWLSRIRRSGKKKDRVSLH